MDCFQVSCVQGDLLQERIQGTKLMLTLDKLDQRFGRGVVKISTQGAYKEWQMRQDRRSPNYTTAWNEILVV